MRTCGDAAQGADVDAAEDANAKDGALALHGSGSQKEVRDAKGWVWVSNRCAAEHVVVEHVDGGGGGAEGPPAKPLTSQTNAVLDIGTATRYSNHMPRTHQKMLGSISACLVYLVKVEGEEEQGWGWGGAVRRAARMT